MRILIVEDDRHILTTLARALTEQHYSVDTATNGEDGAYLGKTNDYDLIILDLMIPRKDGMTVCRELRAEKIMSPILMLTALDSVSSKIEGLDLGADDYMTKPFHIGELLARVRSLVRRRTDQKSTEMQVGDLILDTATRRVTRCGVPISLSAKEFALLEYLMLNAGKALTREMISEHVWDMNFDPQSNVIDSFVRFLRQKVDKDFDRPYIHTVRGVGYRCSEDPE